MVGHAAAQNNLSRLQMSEEGQLGEVVEDDEGKKRDEYGKGSLVDALLDVDADVAAEGAFDQQQQNHAAVQNGEGQQVEDAEVEADDTGQSNLRPPALHLRRIEIGRAHL